MMRARVDECLIKEHVDEPVASCRRRGWNQRRPFSNDKVDFARKRPVRHFQVMNARCLSRTQKQQEMA